MNRNIDENVVEDFGREWSSFNQSQVTEAELNELFDRYFSIFPFDLLSDKSVGFDLGCGSGRWAEFMAPRVGALHCIDPSELALKVARTNLAEHENCYFHQAGVDSLPLADNSMDFGYALGVLHHVPDTEAGIQKCIDKLKPGAPILLYLYYALDNRPSWYRLVWKITNLFRLFISRLPFSAKKIICFLVALIMYLPLARLAFAGERLGLDTRHFPLTSYRHRSFYTMRTDAMDRFGTRLEKRFSRQQISAMLLRSGVERIKFSEHSPFWCVIAFKKTEN
ncbi:MAG: methyltransferase domain-containing protein [Gammaproteobacteria bacterium]|nr:methyltransferase domain-containing protein [Gammaproteobacteria bacterium]